MRFKQYRISRALMYSCFIASGISIWFLNLPFLSDLVGTSILALGLALFLGGAVALAGHILRSVVIERAGYPLLLAALVVLILVLMLSPGQTPARSFLGLLIMGFAFGLYGRYRDLKVLIRLNREAAAVKETG